MGALKLAIRNIFRHRTRALIAFGAIGFGVAALLLAGGFIEWIFFAMKRDTIHSLLGHIQVARTGYFTEGSADPWSYLVPENSDLPIRLGSHPEVQLVASRLSFGGLISHGDTTLSFIGDGVTPQEQEPRRRSRSPPESLQCAISVERYFERPA